MSNAKADEFYEQAKHTTGPERIKALQLCRASLDLTTLEGFAAYVRVQAELRAARREQNACRKRSA